MDELPWLDAETPIFPPTDQALEIPDGLLAAGGNLSIETLIDAYSKGIFPWYSEGEPILWWTPSERAVLFPDDLRLSKGSRKQLRKLSFTLSTNKAFELVIRGCAEQRRHTGTWITEQVIAAYIDLHHEGIAQSVEVWEGVDLVGGLYGVKLGSVFCGESMFNLKDNAAKFAFYNVAHRLFEEGYAMVDCQIPNDFLSSLGVRVCSREAFEKNLTAARTLYCEWPVSWDSAQV